MVEDVIKGTKKLMNEQKMYRTKQISNYLKAAQFVTLINFKFASNKKLRLTSANDIMYVY